MADAIVNVVNGQAVVRPFGSDALIPLVGSANLSADSAKAWAEGTLPGGAGTYSAKEQALLADGSRKRAQNAVAWPTYAALSGATGMSAGDRATVQTTDTGTHTDPVVGGTVNNTGLYQYSASPAGWQRIDDLDSAKALVLAGTTTTSGTANPPVAGTGTISGSYVDATAFGAAGVLQAAVYASADGWMWPYTASLNGDGTVKLEQLGYPTRVYAGQVCWFTDFTPDVTSGQYFGVLSDVACIGYSNTATGKTSWNLSAVIPGTATSGSTSNTKSH